MAQDSALCAQMTTGFAEIRGNGGVETGRGFLLYPALIFGLATGAG